MAKSISLNKESEKTYPNDVLFKQELRKIYREAGAIQEEADNALSLQFSQKAAKVALDIAQTNSANLQVQSNLAAEYIRVGLIYNQLKDSRQAERIL